MVLWLCLSIWMGTGTGSRGGFLGQLCSRRLSEHLQGRPEKLCRFSGRAEPALRLRKCAVSEHAVSWVFAFAGSEQACFYTR